MYQVGNNKGITHKKTGSEVMKASKIYRKMSAPYGDNRMKI